MDTTTGALVIAALSVIVTGFTAFIAPWWARKTERERWANEREAEATRWARQEGTRRTQRGEDAALELIGVVDRAAEHMRSLPKYVQSDIAHFYRDIRRLSLLLTDDDAQARMRSVADGLYFFSQVEYVERSLSHHRAAGVCASAAQDVLRAYLLGRATPPTPRLDRLNALIDAGGRWIAEDMRDEVPDPLVEREGDGDDATKGSGSPT